MTALSNQFTKWANWGAANITVLAGAVTSAQITQTIINSGTDADDMFVFVYHGHGSYTNGPGPNQAGDPPDEFYALPPLNNDAGWLSDDALSAATG